MEIEQMDIAISHTPWEDSAIKKKMTDSISREGNIEKTEYAVFFSRQNFCNATVGKEIGINCYENMEPFIAACKSKRLRAYYKFLMGDLLCGQSDYTKGIDLMLEAISECKNIGYENMPMMSVMFYLLSNRYFLFREYDKCIRYAALSVKYTWPVRSVGIFNTWGLAYQRLGLYDSAAIKFRETIEKARLINSPRWQYIASGNLGRVYCLQGNYKQGLPLLRVDVIMDSASEPDNAAVSSLYMAEAFLKQNEADSARYYIDLGNLIYSNAAASGRLRILSSKFTYYYYEQLSQWCKLKGEYEKALQYTDSFYIYEKKYNEQFDWQVLSSTEKRIEGLEYQQSISLLASQKKNEQLQKIMLLISLFSAVSIGLLIINRQRLKHKKEQQLAAEKEANILLLQQQAQKERDIAHQQLDDFVKMFEEKQLYQHEMTAKLLSLSHESDTIAADEMLTKKMVELINTTLLTNDDWEKFQQRFEKVHPDFFAKLMVAIPDISPAEERLLALLKLKINTRQMASMLGISPESVRKAKYRLRKRLLSHEHPELLQILND